MKPHRITLIVGKRSGKPVLRDIMYHQASRVDFGIAMTPTEESVQAFKRCMPDAWIYRQFQQDKVEDLVNVQRKTLRAGKMPKLVPDHGRLHVRQARDEVRLHARSVHERSTSSFDAQLCVSVPDGFGSRLAHQHRLRHLYERDDHRQQVVEILFRYV